MTSRSFYDSDIEEQSPVFEDMPPYQYRDLGDMQFHDEHRWLKEYFSQYVEYASNRMAIYNYHLDLFKGDHYSEQESYYLNDERGPFTPRHAINYIYDAVDARASLRSKRKSNLNFVPNDEEDIDQYNNAQACSLIYRNRADELKLDALHTKADFHSDIFGDCFMFVLWDGKDVIVKVIPPNRVFPEVRHSGYRLEDCNHIEFVEWRNLWELQAMYPKSKDDLSATEDRGIIDIHQRSHGGDVLVHYFYHRRTERLPQGRFVIYTEDTILYAGDLPYEHGNLPVVHSGDIPIPEYFWHQSFITQVEQIQRANNDVYSSMVRDYGYAGPKWLLPHGAKVKEASLGPGHNIVEYRGMQAPQLANYSPTTTQNYDFLGFSKKEIYDLAKVFDMSRGEVPAGVTANSALRFLDEQESRRSDLLFARKAERIEEVGNQIVSLMAQYYGKDHMQMVRLLGENNEYLIRDFKGNLPDFKKIYRVRTENMSALPSSMTGRIATIIDMNIATQKDPIFSKEEIFHMLNMESDQRFKNAATAAVTTSMEMLKDILEGREVPEIEMSDHTLIYYRVFDRFMQTMRYKKQTPPETREVIKGHMLTIEGLLYEQAKANPRMLDEVLQLKYFPKYFPVDIPLSQLVAQQVTVPETGDETDIQKAVGLSNRAMDNPKGRK